MEDAAQKAQQNRKRSSLIILWLTLSVLIAILLLTPAQVGAMRLLLVLVAAGWWLCIPAMLWRWRRWALPSWGALTIAATILALLPGRAPNQGERLQLRASYLKALQTYKGTTYVWGGENHRGIDCSGLVRQGLIDAQLQAAWTQSNPRLFRKALAMWWFDASAKALRDGYRQMTRVLFRAKSINALDHSKLKPGDLAVTKDGAHVLAYLGNKAWIEADPDLKRVVAITTPARKNTWFKLPVVLVRWQLLNTLNPPRK